MIWTVARVVGFLMLLLAGYFAYHTARQLDQIDSASEVSVIVEVLNGCGRGGIGDRASEFLTDKGFDVMFIGNADDFQYDQTLVIERSGDRTKAAAIAEALGVGQVILQSNRSSFVEVTVVLGKDIAALWARY